MAANDYSGNTRSFLGFVAVIVVIGVWFFGVFKLELMFLNQYVTPRFEISITDWIDRFEMFGHISAGSALLCWLYWYIYGLIKGVTNWRKANQRLAWSLPLYILTILVIVLTFFLLDAKLSDNIIASSILLLNSLLIYYFSTLFSSAPAYSHIPRFWRWKR